MAGNISGYLIVFNFYFQVLSNEDNSVLRVIGPNSDLSGVEMCLDIPEQHTVRTVTTCNILSLHSNQFQRVLSEFPDLDNEFRTLIKNMQEIKVRKEVQKTNKIRS